MCVPWFFLYPLKALLMDHDNFPAAQTQPQNPFQNNENLYVLPNENFCDNENYSVPLHSVLEV